MKRVRLSIGVGARCGARRLRGASRLHANGGARRMRPPARKSMETTQSRKGGQIQTAKAIPVTATGGQRVGSSPNRPTMMPPLVVGSETTAVAPPGRRNCEHKTDAATRETAPPGGGGIDLGGDDGAQRWRRSLGRRQLKPSCFMAAGRSHRAVPKTHLRTLPLLDGTGLAPHGDTRVRGGSSAVHLPASVGGVASRPPCRPQPWPLTEPVSGERASAAAAAAAAATTTRCPRWCRFRTAAAASSTDQIGETGAAVTAATTPTTAAVAPAAPRADWSQTGWTHSTYQGARWVTWLPSADCRAVRSCSQWSRCHRLPATAPPCAVVLADRWDPSQQICCRPFSVLFRLQP